MLFGWEIQEALRSSIVFKKIHINHNQPPSNQYFRLTLPHASPWNEIHLCILAGTLNRIKVGLTMPTNKKWDLYNTRDVRIITMYGMSTVVFKLCVISSMKITWC